MSGTTRSCLCLLKAVHNSGCVAWLAQQKYSSMDGYYLDATDYKMATDKEQTKADGPAGSGLTRSFSNDDKGKEYDRTRERS